MRPSQVANIIGVLVTRIGVITKMDISNDFTIEKTIDGFRQDCSLMVLIWDHKGHYVGQWQVNMIDNDPPELFLKGGVNVPALTPEEMEKAIEATRS